MRYEVLAFYSKRPYICVMRYILKHLYDVYICQNVLRYKFSLTLIFTWGLERERESCCFKKL